MKPFGRCLPLCSSLLCLLLPLWPSSAPGQPVRTFSGHTGQVNHVLFNPFNDSEILSASDDKTVRLWHKPTGALIRTYANHSGRVVGLAVNPFNASEFVSASMDRRVVVWHKESGSVVRSIVAHSGGALAVAYSPLVPNLLLSGGADNATALWDMTTGSVAATFVLNAAVTALQFSPLAVDEIAVGCRDGKVLRYNLSRLGAPLQTLLNHTQEVHTVVYNPRNATELVSGSFENLAVLWDTGSGRVKWSARTGASWGLDVNPANGSEIATVGGDMNTPRIWNRDTGTIVRQFYVSGISTAVAYNPRNATELASGGSDRLVSLWTSTFYSATPLPPPPVPTSPPPPPPLARPTVTAVAAPPRTTTTTTPLTRAPATEATPPPPKYLFGSRKATTAVIASGASVGALAITGLAAWKFLVGTAANAMEEGFDAVAPDLSNGGADGEGAKLHADNPDSGASASASEGGDASNETASEEETASSFV